MYCHLFLQIMEEKCNGLVSTFLEICDLISCPISLEKTTWAAEIVEFLGMLLDGKRKLIVVPLDKKIKAQKMLQFFADKQKVTVKEIQRLAGFLNFLTKAIVPGRGFIRRMYAKLGGLHTINQKSYIARGKILKHYHHVSIDAEFHNDCKV